MQNFILTKFSVIYYYWVVDNVKTRQGEQKMDKKTNAKKSNVVYKNDLNLVSMRKFNSKEMDIFYALCSKMRERGLKEVTFTFNYIRTIANYTAHDKQRFVEDLQETYKNMLQMIYKVETQDEIEYFVLFTGFRINTKEETVTISVNPRFEYILNNINSNFTSFELLHFTSIRSTYAKTLFRMIKQYHSTGVFAINIEDFKFIFDTPKSYQICHIDQKVIKPAIKDLSEFYTIKYEKVKEGKRVKTLVFYFEPIKPADKEPAKSKITMYNWLEGK